MPDNAKPYDPSQNCSLNPLAYYIYNEGFVKYSMQVPEGAKQEINPIYAKFHIFPKIIKIVPFPERSMYPFSQF